MPVTRNQTSIDGTTTEKDSPINQDTKEVSKDVEITQSDALKTANKIENEKTEPKAIGKEEDTCEESQSDENTNEDKEQKENDGEKPQDKNGSEENSKKRVSDADENLNENPEKRNKLDEENSTEESNSVAKPEKE